MTKEQEAPPPHEVQYLIILENEEHIRHFEEYGGINV